MFPRLSSRTLWRQLTCTHDLVSFSRCCLQLFPHTSVALWADSITGIMVTYHQSSRPGSCIRDSILVDFGLSYFSILLSLNVLLTPMIVIRLVLHGRNTCGMMGIPSGLTGLYLTSFLPMVYLGVNFVTSIPSQVASPVPRKSITAASPPHHTSSSFTAVCVPNGIGGSGKHRIGQSTRSDLRHLDLFH